MADKIGFFIISHRMAHSTETLNRNIQPYELVKLILNIPGLHC